MKAEPKPDSAIAFLLPDLSAGGAERVALTIVEALLERGYSVDLLVARREGKLLDAVPPEVRLVDLGASRLSGAFFPLVRYLRRRRPQVLQISMWPLTVIAIAATLLSRVRTRIIVSDHTILSRHYAENARATRLLKWSTRLFYPLADARVVVSAGAADDLAATSGVARERFTVIHNPVLAPTVQNRPGEAEALWSSTRDRIVSVGALKPEKNHRLLISAFARLRSRRPAKLMIVGDGALRPKLEEHAAAEGVRDDVIFTGHVESPSDYIATANLFVLSSDFEGFGNVLVEAMRLGVPVVSTDCPSGPREILDEGRLGRLVPCGNVAALAEAMEKSLDEPPSAAELQQRAEDVSGRASIERWIDLLLDRS